MIAVGIGVILSQVFYWGFIAYLWRKDQKRTRKMFPIARRRLEQTSPKMHI